MPSVADGTDPAAAVARRTARRQLTRVLVVLAGLDLGVLAWVIGVAVAYTRLHFATLDLVLGALGGIVVILGIRLAIGIRLRRRGGDL